MNAETPPRVSIIMPAYNAERHIGASLHSVLAQTYGNYEVIVVDDGSTDGTKTTVMAVAGPIRYLFQSNQGPAAARNKGIAVARGEFICFLDADDLWMPDKLNRQVEFMQKNPAVGMVFSDEDEFDDNGVQRSSLLATSRFHSDIIGGAVIRQPFQKLLEENFIPTSTVMVRRTCFEKTGLFDVELKGPEDRDMWSRIAAYFPIACMPDRLGRKRAVAFSVSRDVETTLRSRIRLWNKAGYLFPDLAPLRTVNALLASAYLQLGFVLLHKDKAREARAVGLRSFRVSRDPSEWFMATSLVIFTFTGKASANFLFRTKRRILSRFSRPS